MNLSDNAIKRTRRGESRACRRGSSNERGPSRIKVQATRPRPEGVPGGRDGWPLLTSGVDECVSYPVDRSMLQGLLGRWPPPGRPGWPTAPDLLPFFR